MGVRTKSFARLDFCLFVEQLFFLSFQLILYSNCSFRVFVVFLDGNSSGTCGTNVEW